MASQSISINLNIKKDYEKESHILLTDDINKNIIENKNKQLIGIKRKKTEYKIKKPKFISENPLDKNIFSIGDFDNYTKRIINDVKNWNKSLKIKNKKRKYRKDVILIKFMARLFKETINKINRNLTIIKSQKKFKYLPKNLIKKYISMILNAQNPEKLSKIDYTLVTIFSLKVDEAKRNNKIENNIDTINYLKKEKNKNIYEKSFFCIFKDLKFSEILNNFVNSKQFGMFISFLKDKNHEEDYIKQYIFQVRKFLNLFLNTKKH